jgi:hypothetical protein
MRQGHGSASLTWRSPTTTSLVGSRSTQTRARRRAAADHHIAAHGVPATARAAVPARSLSRSARRAGAGHARQPYRLFRQSRLPVAGRTDGFLALKRRVEQGVPPASAHASLSRVEPQLEALAPRLGIVVILTPAYGNLRGQSRHAHAARRRPSTCRNHPSSWFQLVKMRAHHQSP